VTEQSPAHDLDQLQLNGAGLRQRLAEVAASLACTEDHVAETMERMALALPYDAVRLRAHAARARRNAALERNRAATFSLPR